MNVPFLKSTVALPALAVLLACSQVRAAQTLKAGDPAPPLKVAKFVKGDKVESFEPGKVYVINFWSSTSVESLKLIPSVSDLQEKYKDSAIVIGVDVWDQNERPVLNLLNEIGDKLANRMALDDKSADSEGAMATTWLDAAGLDGIPASFVVDQKGKIAWIGQPHGLDAVVEKVIAGKFDIATEAAKSEKFAALQKRYFEVVKLREIDSAIKILDEVAADFPEKTPTALVTKFRLLLKFNRYDDAYALGDKLYDAWKDDSQALNELAWSIATDEGIQKRDFEVAQRFAIQAVELTKSENGALVDTLARIYFEQDQVDKAIELQQQAVDIATKELNAATPNNRAELTTTRSELATTLEKYKQIKTGIK